MSTEKSTEKSMEKSTERSSLTISKLNLSRLVDTVHQKDAKFNRSQADGLVHDLDREFEIYRSLLTEGDIDLSDETKREFVKLASYVSTAKRKLQAIESVPTASTNRPKEAEFGVRLPKFSIPRFGGAYVEWPNFRDLFLSSIHNNGQLSNSQKLQYLKSFLIDDALAVIRAIPVADNNYATAWKQLTSRFDRPRFLINSIIENFISCKPVGQDNQTLKLSCSKFSDCIGLLDAQGSYARGRDPWLIFIILSKLDKTTRAEWASHTVKSEEPTIEELLSFLNDKTTSIDLCGGSEFDHTGGQSDPKSKFNNQKSIQRVNNTLSLTCQFCRASHSLWKCDRFENLSAVEREKFAFDDARCFNCLSKGHSSKTCRSTHSCSICKKRHHTLLHREERTDSSGSVLPAVDPTASIVKLNSLQNPSETLMPTARIQIVNDSGRFVAARALLDSGAQCSFISERLVRALGLSRRKSRIPFKCLSSDSPKYSRGSVDFSISPHFDQNFCISIHAQIIKDVIDSLPSSDVELSCRGFIGTKFVLADPEFFVSSPVDLILGASVFFEILRSDRYLVTVDQLYVQDTSLGHIICSKEARMSDETMLNVATFASDESLDRQIERFWVQEEPSIAKPPLTTEESECEDLFSKTTTRLPDGRFCARLPFRKGSRSLGSSVNTALRRFYSLERKLELNPDLRKCYVSFMREYENLGHMSRLDTTISSLEPGFHYIIPHHGIWQHNNSKLRVVFDASARTSNGTSLNDVLHVGPSLQSDLTDIVHSFRKHKYVVGTDIEKMYRQIVIDPADRPFQLIVWRYSKSEPLMLYELNTVTYGETCSPYLALRVLQELASMEGKHHPLAYKILMNCRFVDDILFGADDLDSLIEMRNDLIDVLKKGCFSLKKWVSNTPLALEGIPSSDQSLPLLFGELSSDQCVKTLGLTWLPDRDVFKYGFDLPRLNSHTKRTLLSEAARLFDPIGWISPVVLLFKFLIQESWIRKMEWDSELPDDITSSWNATRDSLNDLTKLEIPRFLENGFRELHGFADASSKAFAASVYLRSVSSDGKITVRLLCSKTKLAPIKQVSIPRLELCASHLLSKLIAHLQTVFNVPSSDITMYSDSEIVLSWIHSMPRKWSTYVGNRVSQIHNLCPGVKWRHVCSEENPADIASRGARVTELLQLNLWWDGPQFLYDRVLVREPPLIVETAEEAKPFSLLSAITAPDVWIQFTERFSSLGRAVRSFATVLRVAKSRFRNVERGIIDSSEYEFALNQLIINIQRAYFKKDFFRLLSSRNVSRDSRLKSLLPFVDDSGILRSKTRLTVLHSPEFSADPIIIPKSHLALLLIRQAHQKTFHGGFQLIASTLRRSYWIIGSSRLIKSISKNCVRCSRYEGRTFGPTMGPLPEHRVIPAKPFLHVGIDFAGPFDIRPFKSRGNLTKKGYICVIVCLSTKAFHVDLVMGLDADSLIYALKRFVSRRGKCSSIISDNGRNFVSAARQLNEYQTQISKNLNCEELQIYLTEEKISWSFNPPYSPNFGGLWEAGVKSIKRHLNRMFGRSVFSYDELLTALYQIENLLNSRPLTPVKFTENFIPLTPNHFLIGRQGSCSALDCVPPSNLKNFLHLEEILKGFWRRWRDEYVNELVKRSKDQSYGTEPKIGDIVLIKRPNDSPKSWRMGKVVGLHPGSDKVFRVADVMTSQGTKREAVRHLVLLNVDPSDQRGEHVQ